MGHAHALPCDAQVSTEGLKLNAETHLPPLLCTAVKARLEGAAPGVVPSPEGVTAGA